MINVSAALDSHTSQPAIIERKTSGQYVDGVWRSGATKKIRCLASIQPINEDIDAGNGQADETTSEMWTIYCTKPLIGSKSIDQTTGDIIIYKKKRYKVMGKTNWFDYGYAQGVVALVEEPIQQVLY